MHRLPLFALVLLTACATGGAGSDGPDPTPDITQADSAVAELVARRIAATNAQDWDTWQHLHADGCVRTAPDLRAPLTTSADMRAAITRLGNAFPDYHVALIRLLGQGPWYAAELQSSGTMKHALEVPGSLAIPPTGRHFRQRCVAFFRLEHGVIAEFHERYDQTNLVDQLTGKDVPKAWED
jgi:predicted ester cyclase